MEDPVGGADASGDPHGTLEQRAMVVQDANVLPELVPLPQVNTWCGLEELPKDRVEPRRANPRIQNARSTRRK